MRGAAVDQFSLKRITQTGHVVPVGAPETAHLESKFQSCRDASILHEPWGIEHFDRCYGGLLAGVFNILAASDHDAAIAAVGHFLAQGLEDQQRVALVGFDNPQLLFSKFALYGWDFIPALESERLVYIYYKPAFFHTLSFTDDYKIPFAELRRLTGAIERLAFLNADALLNLQSEYLARDSAVKLAAAGCGSTTTLGCFVHQNTASHRLIEMGCCSLMPSYLVLRALPHHVNRRYALEWRKGPGFCTQAATLLELETGRGYVKR